MGERQEFWTEQYNKAYRFQREKKGRGHHVADIVAVRYAGQKTRERVAEKPFDDE